MDEVVYEIKKEIAYQVKLMNYKTLKTVKTELREKVFTTQLDKAYPEHILRWEDVVQVFSKYLKEPLKD